MVPDWRIAQIRAGASVLCQALSDQSLSDLGQGTHVGLKTATGDNREELQAMMDSINAEVSRRGTLTATVRA
jgi:hypothetical protein